MQFWLGSGCLWIGDNLGNSMEEQNMEELGIVWMVWFDVSEINQICYIKGFKNEGKDLGGNYWHKYFYFPLPSDILQSSGWDVSWDGGFQTSELDLFLLCELVLPVSK